MKASRVPPTHAHKGVFTEEAPQPSLDGRREGGDTAKSWLIMPEAMPAWRRLTAALEDVEPPCAADPDAWHDHQTVQVAATSCQRCPARDACANYAITAHESGVWGGVVLSQRERPHRRGKTGAA